MSFIFSNLLLGSAVSSQAATNSAIGMIGSFLAAAALIVVPAASFLIWGSQKDALQRTGGR